MRADAPGSRQPGSGAQLPAVFAAQGAPPLVDHPRWTAELAAWGRALPRPEAILVVSAHWEQHPLAHGATSSPVPLYYDFGGLPQRYYQLAYPAPGAPDLAGRVAELMAGSGGQLAAKPGRGLDHGAFIPLLLMFPAADIPVLQLSMPTLEPEGLLGLGRQLAGLRKEGVLIFATGLLTHTFDIPDLGNPDTPPDPALAEFDSWVAETLRRGDTSSLLHFRDQAPGVQAALPSDEHFAPLFVALGAAAGGPASVTFPHQGFWYGNSMRSVQFG
jgi:4,5-DOPA dioxygenase extradiol